MKLHNQFLLDHPCIGLLVEYKEYYDSHPHDLKRCDGTYRVYRTIEYIERLDSIIYKYEYNPRFPELPGVWISDTKILVRRTHKVISQMIKEGVRVSRKESLI